MSETDEEFTPLPYFPWSERPSTVPIDIEECATALYLSGGNVVKAAGLLKIDGLRLERIIRRSPRLITLRDELYATYSDRAAAKVMEALDADDTRVQWAAALKILNSRVSAGHPFSPISATNNGTIDVVPDDRTITIRWGNPPAGLDSPSMSDHSGLTIEGQSVDEGRGSSD